MKGEMGHAVFHHWAIAKRLAPASILKIIEEMEKQYTIQVGKWCVLILCGIAFVCFVLVKMFGK